MTWAPTAFLIITIDAAASNFLMLSELSPWGLPIAGALEHGTPRSNTHAQHAFSISIFSARCDASFAFRKETNRQKPIVAGVLRKNQNGSILSAFACCAKENLHVSQTSRLRPETATRQRLE